MKNKNENDNGLPKYQPSTSNTIKKHLKAWLTKDMERGGTEGRRPHHTTRESHYIEKQSQSSTVESSSRDRDAAADSSPLDLNLAPSINGPVRFPFQHRYTPMPVVNQTFCFDDVLRAGMVNYGYATAAPAQSDSDSSSVIDLNHRDDGVKRVRNLDLDLNYPPPEYTL
ncbi:hypothetical protein TSUD_386030 [Trifolium subterraneum]|uniref:Uncharacterized protein n=1 Tax=Trifolium subterraneum TaxID=3900 RepID=A0A2Z6LVG8_TRISU|nr:hypothetical protein TSUD_386030 [Trifolium subterraneum]